MCPSARGNEIVRQQAQTVVTAPVGSGPSTSRGLSHHPCHGDPLPDDGTRVTRSQDTAPLRAVPTASVRPEIVETPVE